MSSSTCRAGVAAGHTRADDARSQPIDLDQAIEATLVVASNEHTYVADLATDLSPLPEVSCDANELNQWG